MEKTFIAVRDVDKDVFRKFRARSVAERMKLGDAITKAMKRAMEERREPDNKPDARNLFKIKPIKVGKKVRWSEEIDEILYGSKK